MSLGYAFSKQRIDAQVADAVYQLREVLARMARFRVDLDALSDAELTALGYTAAEVAALRSSLVDLDKLSSISHGLATQSTPYDFFTFAKQLVRLS